jgi:hypothetical protein
MKKFSFLTALCIVFIMVSFAGCKKYNRPAVVQIQTNEVAFLVDMTNDNTTSSGTDVGIQIQRKDVEIRGYWIKTGRLPNSGYWRPEQKVMVVSKKPTSIEWSADTKDPTIKVASKESVGFTVPILLNATVENDNDAKKYLQWFKSTQIEEAKWEKLEAKEWGPYVREEAETLESAVNRVIFPKVNDLLAQLFIQTPIVDCEVKSKDYVPAIFNGGQVLLPNGTSHTVVVKDGDNDYNSVREWAKQRYGITLLTLAATDGLIYDDANFQRLLNERAVQKLQEDVLAQKNTNAIAEQKVAITNAETERRVAAEKAASMSTLRIQQEIENLRLVGLAEAEAIKNGKVVPKGTLPMGLTNITIIADSNGLDSFGVPIR